MIEPNPRMTEPGKVPAPQQVAAWIGKDAHDYWTRLTKWIGEKYPNVFAPEWLFGGKKHGWSLRFKKGKSFCTLIPEKGRCRLLIVFGGAERDKVEHIREEISPLTMKLYDEANTYHDGKWLLLTVDNDQVEEDIERLLALKRRPKPE